MSTWPLPNIKSWRNTPLVFAIRRTVGAQVCGAEQISAMERSPPNFPHSGFFALRKLVFFFGFSPMHAPSVPSLRLITRAV